MKTISMVLAGASFALLSHNDLLLAGASMCLAIAAALLIKGESCDTH